MNVLTRLKLIMIAQGVLFCLLIASVATVFGRMIPIVGAPIFGITFGIILSNIYKQRINTTFRHGIDFTGKKILQLSIIVMGFSFSIKNIVNVGVESLTVTIVTLVVALFTVLLFSRILKTRYKLSALIGVGTAICGGSAIAALSPIVNADEQDISYSMSTIFFFNILAVFIFPFIAHIVSMNQLDFGLWAGVAINDTSSVVAAAYSYGDVAGAHATVVKLTRATLIIPIALIFVVVEFLRSRREGGVNFIKIFPWFILLFVLAALVNSFIELPQVFVAYSMVVSKFFITMALVAIGLKTDIRMILRSGVQPLLLGAITWFMIATVTYILI